MTKIAISTYQAAQLSAARRAGERRTHIWASIRDMFGIPRTLKLGMATDRSLYVKGTEPRQFLIADTRGRYGSTATDAQIANQQAARSAGAVPVAMTVSPAAASQASQGQIQGAGSAFRVLNAQTPATDWRFVPTADLADALRNSGYGDETPNLPVGFPTDAGADAVVVTDDGVYFRNCD